MCDTIVALLSATADGSIIFAKNSDREANEMQALEYHPAGTYRPGERLKCTYIDIEQTEQTHAVLISRPFWMWGAEMGVNEKGVAIGNEAIWTKMPLHRKNDRLLGMDLLRLGLERGATAREALEVICDLLGRYGQGGIAGYQDKSMAYHNSFLIADRTEAWVLETAEHLWIARKVQNTYAISNGTTIEEEYDLIHPDIIDTAIRKGWHRKGQTFNFRKSFSDWFYTTFSGSRQRHTQSSCYLRDEGGRITVASAIKALQTHYRENYSPEAHLLGNSVCAHAGLPLTRHATQSTASMVAHLTENPCIWVTATSSACSSIFKPLWLLGEVLPDLGKSGPVYDPDNYWWQNERFHRTLLRNYSTLFPFIRPELEALQSEFLQTASSIPKEERPAFTSECFGKASAKAMKWTELLIQQKTTKSPNFLFHLYWKRLNEKAGIIL